MKFFKINTHEPDGFQQYIQGANAATKRGDTFLRHVHEHSPQGSFVFGFSVEGEIIASVSYIGHSICRDGEIGTAFQACNVFTNAEYRGQGLFTKIARMAEEELSSLGASAIIGFPNEKAAPIWTSKLGYSICKTRPILVPRFGLIKCFNEEDISRDLASSEKITFDARETSIWKKTIHNDLFEDDYLTNYIFGRVLNRKRLGLQSRVLVIAGLEINKPHVFEMSIRRLMKRLNCSLCRISVNESSAFSKSAKFVRGSNLTEPFIAKGLNWDVSASSFEATGGVKDVF